MKRLAAAALIALAFPAGAAAHATLTHESPAFGQRLARAPAQVRLGFDQSVKALPNAIQVLTAKGRLVSGATSSSADKRTIAAPVRRLPRGAYTVRWSAISSDGHVISGVFTFGVRHAAPPATEAYGASGPTRSEHVVRWLYFLSLALLAGGLAFRLLVLHGPIPAAAARRFYLVVGAGAVGVLEVGILAFLLRAEDALQLPFSRFLYGDLSPIAHGTRFGTAFIAMTLGFAFVSALVFLAWLTDRTVLLWPALLLALGFASGLSLSGHSAADAGSSWFSAFADWVHLAAASLWVGGLVQLAFVVWPLAPEQRRRAFLGFSRFATALIVLILSAGVYLSILRLPRLDDLWAASYGRVLLVKLALVSLALLWGAAHHFLVRPALERGAPRFHASPIDANRFDRSVQTDAPDLDGRAGKAGTASLNDIASDAAAARPENGIASAALARLPRSLAGESAVGMAILLAAAVLVDSKPPPQPVSKPPLAVRQR